MQTPPVLAGNLTGHRVLAQSGRRTGAAPASATASTSPRGRGPGAWWARPSPKLVLKTREDPPPMKHSHVQGLMLGSKDPKVSPGAKRLFRSSRIIAKRAEICETRETGRNPVKPSEADTGRRGDTTTTAEPEGIREDRGPGPAGSPAIPAPTRDAGPPHPRPSSRDSKAAVLTPRLAQAWGRAAQDDESEDPGRGLSRTQLLLRSHHAGNRKR